MGGSFIDYQVLYTDQIPTTPIRLGQLLVDESEAAPLDMLKYCSSLSPLTYTSFSDGILPLIPVGANPTASVGLSAINGTATTFLRSDGAPALDQGISPAWTGAHQFNLPVSFQSAQSTYPAAQNPPAIFGTSGSFTTPAGYASVGGHLVLQSRSNSASAMGVFLAAGQAGVDQTLVLGARVGVVSVLGDGTELRFGTGGDDLAIYHDGTNNYLDSNTGALRLRDSGGATKIELNTTGLGFNGATPIARPDYTVTNPSTSRSLNVSSATLAQLRAVVGTMIQDLIDYGLYQ